MNSVLACPLLEIPVVVFQADLDALSKVAQVRNGPEEVGLDQCDVIKLRGTGCTSLTATWIQEHLKNTHTHKVRKAEGREIMSAFRSSEAATVSTTHLWKIYQ